MIESLLILLLYIVIIGAVLWFINVIIDRVPMDPTFKSGAKLLVVVVGIIILVLLLIRYLPALPALP
jgi:hypothetical protein